MSNHENEIAELRLWAKDDIVPQDLKDLCKTAAGSIEDLQSMLGAANHDYAELMKERTDYVADNKQQAEFLSLAKEQMDALQAESERLKAIVGQVVCAYCGMEFDTSVGDLKDKIAGLAADHIISCEKNPLVKTIEHLKRVIKRYATHDPDCHKVSIIGVDNDCTCGFDQP